MIGAGKNFDLSQTDQALRKTSGSLAMFAAIRRASLGPAHGSPDIFDDLAVPFNDQFQGVTLLKHAVAGFERNPSARLRGVRLTALGDAHTVVDHEGVSTVGFD